MPRVIATLGGLLLAALLALACGSTPPQLNQDQAKFKKTVLAQLSREKKILEPLFSQKTSGTALQKNIDQQFARAIAQGKPMYHDLAVLDASATILAWRSPDPKNPSQTYLGYIGQNYSHFKAMQPVFKDKRIAAFEVFTQYGPGFGVCAPMSKDDKFLGAVCLGYDYDVLTKRHGLDKKELLAIDFNR